MSVNRKLLLLAVVLYVCGTEAGLKKALQRGEVASTVSVFKSTDQRVLLEETRPQVPPVKFYYNPNADTFYLYDRTVPITSPAPNLRDWILYGFDLDRVPKNQGHLPSCCRLGCQQLCITYGNGVEVRVVELFLEKWDRVTQSLVSNLKITFDGVDKSLYFLDKSQVWKPHNNKLPSYKKIMACLEDGFPCTYVSGESGHEIEVRLSGTLPRRDEPGVNDGTELLHQKSFDTFQTVSPKTASLADSSELPVKASTPSSEVKVLKLPHYTAGIDIIPMSKTGKAFHWWLPSDQQNGYDDLTRALMKEVLNDEHWTDVMLDTEDKIDGSDPVSKLARAKDSTGLSFLDTRCVASTHSMLAILENESTKRDVFAHANMETTWVSQRPETHAAFVAKMSSWDDDAPVNDKKVFFYGFTFGVSESGQNPAVPASPGCKDPSPPGQGLGHVFSATQEGGSGAHPPVFWETNYFLMNMADFTRGMPRVRSSLRNFAEDVNAFLSAPTRLDQKRWYIKLFGGAHLNTQSTYGDGVAVEQRRIDASWLGLNPTCTSTIDVDVELAKLPPIPFTMWAGRIPLDRTLAINNVKNSKLFKTIAYTEGNELPGSSTGSNGHRNAKLVQWEKLYSWYDKKQYRCCVSQPSRLDGSLPAYCKLVREDSACQGSPAVKVGSYTPYSEQGNLGRVTVHKNRAQGIMYWAKREIGHSQDSVQLSISPCELPYNIEALQKSQGNHRVLSSSGYGKKPLLNEGKAMDHKYSCCAHSDCLPKSA